MSKLDRARHSAFLIWSIIGIVILLVVFGYVLGQVWNAISIILFSAFLVFTMRTPVAWMERHGISRLIGSLITYIVAILVVTVVLLIFLPILVEQLEGFIALVPDYVDEAIAWWNDFYARYSYLLADSTVQQWIADASEELSKWTASLASISANSVVAAGTSVANVFLVFSMSLVVGFWVLKDLPRMSKEFRILFGPKWDKDITVVSTTCSRVMGGYIKGMLIASTCTGTICGIGYWILGLPYPAVLGLLTGLMNFIPYVGPWIAGTVAAIVGLFISPLIAIVSIAVTVAAQQFTDTFISPRVMSSTVELHPAMLLVALIAGGALGGIIGMIVVVPITASAKALFVYYFEKRTGRVLLSTEGAIFKGAPMQGLDPMETDDDTADDATDREEDGSTGDDKTDQG